MRNWTVQVNLDGGFAHKALTLTIEASNSALALSIAHESMEMLGFGLSDYQAHII